MKRLESRLAKLETTRREAQARAGNPSGPPTWWQIMGGAEPPAFTFAALLAAAERSDPPDDDPDYLCENVVDVESELLKIKDDRDGWRARQRELKRDLAEMVRRDWPDIDAEPAAGDGQTAGECRASAH